MSEVKMCDICGAIVTSKSLEHCKYTDSTDKPKEGEDRYRDTRSSIDVCPVCFPEVMNTVLSTLKIGIPEHIKEAIMKDFEKVE